MTRDKIDKIFESYGQYATGKDYALVNAVAEAVLSQRTWVELTDKEIKALAKRPNDIEIPMTGRMWIFVGELMDKLKEKNSA